MPFWFASEPVKEGRARDRDGLGMPGISRDSRLFFGSQMLMFAGKLLISYQGPGVFRKRRVISGEHMPVTAIGYQRLIDQRDLSALPLSQVARIDTRVKGRETQAGGTGTQLLFEPRYQPEASFEGDLQFALRYEGVNLEVLELLFTQAGPQPLVAWLRAQPESSYARRGGFLFS